MNNLKLFTGNRLEILADKLAEVLRDPLPSALTREIVVVQNKGMERWVSMQLARRHAICANCWFPFPNSLIRDIFRRTIPDLPETSPYEPGIMTWKIMKVLPACLESPGFESLRHYLGDAAGRTGDLKLFQLAERIADTFDQYLLYRPDMIAYWEEGRETHWQSVLWREIVKITEGKHRAALRGEFLEMLSGSSPVIDNFPARISIFGISAIPPFHMEIFTALAAHIRVNLFLMNPCREYWGEILSSREMKRIRGKTGIRRDEGDKENTGKDGCSEMGDSKRIGKEQGSATGSGESAAVPDDADLHMETGNSLLASMGTVGKDFLRLILDQAPEEVFLFEDPGHDSLLRCIQSDILNLRDGVDIHGRDRSKWEEREDSETKDQSGEEGSDIEDLTRTGNIDENEKVDEQEHFDVERGGAGARIERDDDSIQIHSCHSPMREIEVLQDRLLDMFERNPDLRPGDIVVMTPDIETYAPYIQAVFDLPLEDKRRIPFSIADRSLMTESRMIDTFLAILNLRSSRFGASQVLSIIEAAPVRQRFELTEEDVDLLRTWVRETRIRWGVDGENRASMGLPPFDENTWRAGLERLLLGYAMPGRGKAMFGDLLPYDDIEGGEAEVLGKLCQFAEQLFDTVGSLERPRTLSEWSALLAEVIEKFFAPKEGAEGEMRRILAKVNGLAEMEVSSLFDENVAIDVILWHLQHYFKRESFGFGFMTGGATFCAILPMRSIPFKVTCLVGMNDDVYPGQTRPPGFDLMARNPRPCDRSRRNDDRFLFLEAILSAREKLYISYIGQSIRDNGVRPPSVLVSELIDYIERHYTAKGEHIPTNVVTQHRLQAFSPAYFGDSEKLFSYSREQCATAQRLLEPHVSPEPFIKGGLPEPEEGWDVLDLDDLCLFFDNPSRFLLTRRLALRLDQDESILEEVEPFSVAGLEKYSLENEMVDREFAGEDVGKLYLLTKASGRLPHGAVGESLYNGFTRDSARFVEKTEPYLREATLAPLNVDIALSGIHLVGRITCISSDHAVRYRYTTIKPKDRLRMWIHHLALNAARADGHPLAGMLIGLDDGKDKLRWCAWEFTPVRECENILGNLLALFHRGLVTPLHFFPKSSWDYSRALRERNKREDEALRSARNTWEGNDRARGECENSYYRLCFGGTDPLDSGFEEIALDIFAPLMEHQRKL